MEPYFFFYVGLSFILTHEMDAVKQREWRIFPLTAWLEEKPGYFIFTTLHIPLYVLLFWGLYGADGPNRGLIRGIDIFLIVHVFLHLLFLKHSKNEFKSALSWIIIVGAGVAGIVDLIVSF